VTAGLLFSHESFSFSEHIRQRALQPVHYLLQLAQGDALLASLQPKYRGRWQSYFLGKGGEGEVASLFFEKFRQFFVEGGRHPSRLRKWSFLMRNVFP
jgi:hypothetical protein